MLDFDFAPQSKALTGCSRGLLVFRDGTLLGQIAAFKSSAAWCWQTIPGPLRNGVSLSREDAARALAAAIPAPVRAGTIAGPLALLFILCAALSSACSLTINVGPKDPYASLEAVQRASLKAAIQAIREARASAESEENPDEIPDVAPSCGATQK